MENLRLSQTFSNSVTISHAVVVRMMKSLSPVQTDKNRHMSEAETKPWLPWCPVAAIFYLSFSQLSVFLDVSLPLSILVFTLTESGFSECGLVVVNILKAL